jgi:hypothetical protein
MSFCRKQNSAFRALSEDILPISSVEKELPENVSFTNPPKALTTRIMAIALCRFLNVVGQNYTHFITLKQRKT